MPTNQDRIEDYIKYTQHAKILHMLDECKTLQDYQDVHKEVKTLVKEEESKL